MHWQVVQTIIHPDPLTVGAMSLSYDLSVMARNVPYVSASHIQATLMLPSTTCFHIHSPPIERRWDQNDVVTKLGIARAGPISR